MEQEVSSQEITCFFRHEVRGSGTGAANKSLTGIGKLALILAV
jgi:hypothetical protein